MFLVYKIFKLSIFLFRRFVVPDSEEDLSEEVTEAEDTEEETEPEDLDLDEDFIGTVDLGIANPRMQNDFLAIQLIIFSILHFIALNHIHLIFG